MKKLIGVLLASMMAVSMTACGSGDKIEQASPPVQTPQTTQQTESRTESVPGDEDWQNPVMNFIGPYKAGETEMFIEAVGKDTAAITVTRPDGSNGSSTWVMSGVFDWDTFKVEYTDCVKTDITLTENGETAEQTEVYKDGTGRVMFNAQDSTIIWEDEMEHAADDLVFEFSFTASDESDESSLADLAE